jgi:hypothetical protein
MEIHLLLSHKKDLKTRKYTKNSDKKLSQKTFLFIYFIKNVVFSFKSAAVIIGLLSIRLKMVPRTTIIEFLGLPVPFRLRNVFILEAPCFADKAVNGGLVLAQLLGDLV